MDESLYPVFDVPAIVDEGKQYKTAYMPSVAWDFNTGDFVRNGANQMAECEGSEAFKTWCMKMVCTERYTCLAYSDDIGVEIDAALKEKVDGAVESAVKRTITEALMVNPRTEYVRDFSFQRVRDKLRCSFVVKGREIEAFPITVLMEET